MDPAALVSEVGEDGLAVVADNKQPTGGYYALFALVVGDRRKLRPDVRNCILTLEGGGVEVDAFFPQCTDFVEPGRVKG